MIRLTYGEQLKHPSWQKRRLERLAKANWMCARCCSVDVTLHVHHRRYVRGRQVWEYSDDELAVLCADCHASAHEEQDRLNLLLAQLDDDGPKSIEAATALLAGWASSVSIAPIARELYGSEPSLVLIGELVTLLDRYVRVETILGMADELARDPYGFRKRLDAAIAAADDTITPAPELPS